ncbi:hypothetical protein NNX28_16235 [Arthrobacter sp. zg-Y859]|uniref:Uncharacterized protein n=1 Tax=Arthrobacter jinronghuae TaxID=2964609 RepID=A0ABT1NUR0_9MICC|nr:hypothetical protein [Arthrobacter jinronghuae]MCQ1951471.1 hypothetical protein [Arthrobacter jinronghuae]UWX78889.1 hypothetical protein N2K98_01325 [Arthrobacter jinronghuae]
MRSSRTTDTLPAASSLVRRRALRAVSLLLAGGLALTGCAADVASTSGTASPSAASDSSSSTAADPKMTSATTTRRRRRPGQTFP